MQKEKVNVLITSVGGGVGQSVVDSLSFMRKDYRIIGLDIDATIYSRNQCEEFYISPRIRDQYYLQFLIGVCESEKVDVLIPGNDGELELLSDNIDLFSQIGTCVVVSPSEVVKSSRNKYDWFKRHSTLYNIVETALLVDFVSSNDLYKSFEFPVICKPVAGSASLGISIYGSYQELLLGVESIEDKDNYVVQPYLLPKTDDPDYERVLNAVRKGMLVQLSEVSCQFVYSNDSRLLGMFASVNSLKNGVPVSIVPIVDQGLLSELYEIGERIRIEKPIGPVNLQGRQTDKGIIFFEMNLRFTGITGARAKLGFNEVSAVVDNFVSDEDPVLLTTNTLKVAARQVACTSFYQNRDISTQVIMITGAGSWSARNFIFRVRESSLLKGKRLILSSRDPVSLRKKLENHSPGITLDIQFVGVEHRELALALSGCDILINFVSARPPHGNEKLLDSTRFNLTLADLLKKVNVGLILNISSQSVYKPSSFGLLDETATLSCDSIYSTSKILLEHAYGLVENHSTGSRVVNLRIGRLWAGEFELVKDQFPFKMLSAMMGNGEFKIHDPSNRISMLDVDCLTVTIARLICSWEKGNELPKALNIGGSDVSLNSLVLTLEELLNELGIIFKPLSIKDTEGNRPVLTLSNSTAEKIGVYVPISVKDSWRKVLNLYLRKY